jgi:hypothetical protein
VCGIAIAQLLQSCSIQNAFCSGIAILQHCLLWRQRRRNTFPRQIQIFVHSVIVASLVTSPQTRESVTFFLNYAICTVKKCTNEQQILWTK